MTFSILFGPTEGPRRTEDAQRPESFGDLSLDRVVEAIVQPRDPYRLTPLFSEPLTTVDGIQYRHEALRDLRGAPVAGVVDAFAEQLTRMHQYLTLVEHLRFEYSIKGWFLYAAGLYCQALDQLDRDLASARLDSRAFREFRERVRAYVASPAFTRLRADVASTKERLATVSYSLTLDGDRIHVTDYRGEPDYTSQMTAVFAKFDRRGEDRKQVGFRSSPDMNHVEGAILDLVAQLNPEVFGELDAFCAQHADFLDPMIVAFEREVQFYVCYLHFAGRLERAGLAFCYPRVVCDSKSVSARDTFDIALADKLTRAGDPVVTNDFALTGPERILVVTGPNQGGKTTFARTFGQLHVLGRLGLLVPGTDAQLYLYDRIFTHFEKQEDPLSHHGKLEDDLLRIRDILDAATGRSIVIMNEIFTSTALDDAVFLGTRVLEQLIERDVLSVCVTFLDELAGLDESTVSMVSTVEPDDPTVRTLKIVRQPADGLAYAAAIADKYGVSYARLRERLAS